VVWDIDDVKDTMAEWHEVEIDAISDETALEVLSTVLSSMTAILASLGKQFVSQL
jgi:hypothetical protein